MKRLVFKKWVEITLFIIGFIGFFMVAAFEWNSIIPYFVGLALMLIPTLLETIYGRED